MTDYNSLLQIILFEFEHPDQTYRFASTQRPITVGGNTFEASGNLITASDVIEAEGNQAQRIQVTLSLQSDGDQPVQPVYFMSLRDQRVSGARVNIDLLFLDQDGSHTHIEPLWRGSVDGINVNFERAEAVFDVLSQRGVSRIRDRMDFSEAHHAEIYPDDKFFEFQVNNQLAVIERRTGGRGSFGGD